MPKLPKQPRTAAAKARYDRFVEEYLVDMNGTKAAIRAGYAPGSAAQTGSDLLKVPYIADSVERAIAARSARTNIRQDEVLEELRILMRSSIEHYEVDDYGNVTLAEGAPSDALRAVAKVKKRTRTVDRGDEGVEVIRETEIQLWDKNPSLRMAGQHLGMYTEKVQHSGEVNVTQTWRVGDKEIVF